MSQAEKQAALTPQLLLVSEMQRLPGAQAVLSGQKTQSVPDSLMQVVSPSVVNTQLQFTPHAVEPDWGRQQPVMHLPLQSVLPAGQALTHFPR